MQKAYIILFLILLLNKYTISITINIFYNLIKYIYLVNIMEKKIIKIIFFNIKK